MKDRGWISIGEVAANIVKELRSAAPRRMTVPAFRAQIRAMPETPREAFRRIRKASDLTLPQLCRILGTPTISMITYVEQGKRRIPRAWLQRLPPEFVPVLQAVIREKLDELDELEKLLRRAATGRWPRTAPKPVPGSVASYKGAVAQAYRLHKEVP